MRAMINKRLSLILLAIVVVIEVVTLIFMSESLPALRPRRLLWCRRGIRSGPG